MALHPQPFFGFRISADRGKVVKHHVGRKNLLIFITPKWIGTLIGHILNVPGGKLYHLYIVSRIPVVVKLGI